MFILNWDFDVLPITFDENLMLGSLAESMKYDHCYVLISNSNYDFMDN